MGKFLSLLSNENSEYLNDLQIIINNNKTNKFPNKFRNETKEILNNIEDEKSKEKINMYKKIIYKKALNNIQREIIKLNLFEFNEILKKTNSLIAGSFSICSIFEISNFKYNDIDIFTENPQKILKYFNIMNENNKYKNMNENNKYKNMNENNKYKNMNKNNKYKNMNENNKYKNMNENNKYKNMNENNKYKNMNENNILNVFNINYNDLNIQIIEVKHIKYFIENCIDLDCCKLCYDGEILKTYGSKNITELLIETSKGETSFNLKKSEIKTKINRLKKYSSRGFKIKNIEN
jgi:hypothetical protein